MLQAEPHEPHVRRRTETEEEDLKELQRSVKMLITQVQALAKEIYQTRINSINTNDITKTRLEVLEKKMHNTKVHTHKSSKGQQVPSAENGKHEITIEPAACPVSQHELQREYQYLYMATEQNKKSKEPSRESWTFDSGSSYHITNSIEDFDPGTLEACNITLNLGNNKKIEVRWMGTCTRTTLQNRTIVMAEVLLANESPTRIMAIGKLTKKGTSIFTQDDKNVTLKAKHTGEVILKGKVNGVGTAVVHMKKPSSGPRREEKLRKPPKKRRHGTNLKATWMKENTSSKLGGLDSQTIFLNYDTKRGVDFGGDKNWSRADQIWQIEKSYQTQRYSRISTNQIEDIMKPFKNISENLVLEAKSKAISQKGAFAQAVYLQNQRVQTSEGSKPHLHSTTLACTKPHTHSCTTDDKLVSRKLCSVSDGTSINPNVINTSTDQTPLDVQLNTKCEPNTLLDSTHEDLHSIVVEQKNCVSGLNETDKDEEERKRRKKEERKEDTKGETGEEREDCEGAVGEEGEEGEEGEQAAESVTGEAEEEIDRFSRNTLKLENKTKKIPLQQEEPVLHLVKDFKKPYCVPPPNFVVNLIAKEATEPTPTSKQQNHLCSPLLPFCRKVLWLARLARLEDALRNNTSCKS